MPVDLLAETDVLQHGATLGKYEVLRKLATGGMAEIYLARVRGIVGFEKLVVLKRILPNMAEDPAFVRMFLDEARLAATLQHPNIADVYDVGNEGKLYFFTMEFIHGEDARTVRFHEHKRGQRIPLANALAIVHGTASALAYAHDKAGPDGPLGLVHRDVSASNILVSFDGAVKLVDFGIARATAKQTKTRTGSLKGKIPYMSPEQCRNHALDRRSDLFSLGVVLYELTAGRRPFRGDSDFEVLDQIINHGATPPSQLVPDYPPDLERVVMKSLERSPDKRYQNGEEMIADLEKVMTAHGAWTSPVAMGRYMRGLFAKKIEAWHQAEQDGVPLGEHVAHTITSESVRGELRITPVSMSAQPEPVVVSAKPSVQLATPEPKLPELRSSSAGKWVVASLAVALIGGGVLAYNLAGSSDERPQQTTTQEAPKPEPKAEPKSEPKVEPAAKVEPAVNVEPAAKVEEPKPEPAPAKVEPAKPEPAKPIAKTVPKQKPIPSKTKQVATKPKPVEKPAEKPVEKPKPPDPKPPDKLGPSAGDKKDQWDPNSFTLPK